MGIPYFRSGKDRRMKAVRIPDDPPASSGDTAVLAGGASLALAGKIGGNGIDLVTNVVVARVLGPESFGLYAIGATLLRMLGLLAPMGMDKGVIRFGTVSWRENREKFRDVLFQSFGLAFTIGLALGISLYLLAPWLAEQVFRKPGLEVILQWFSIAFPLASGFAVALAATRISQRMQYTVLAQDIFQPMLGLLLVVSFFLAGIRLTGVLAAEVLSLALSLLLTIHFVHRLYPDAFPPPFHFTTQIRELISFSVPAMMAGVFNTFIIWTDRLVVGLVRPSSEVGIYQAVSQTSTVFAIILAGFSLVFTPMIADLYHRKKMHRLQELFQISTKWGLYLSLPIILLIVFFPREILSLLYDPRYAAGWLPFLLLSLGQLINVGTGAVGPIFVMTGHQHRWMILTGTCFLVNITLILCLLPVLGLAGAALGTSLSLAGMFLIGLFVLRKKLGLWPYDRRYRKGLVATLVTSGILLILRFSGFSIDGPVLLVIILGVVAVFFCLLLLQGLEKEDGEFLRLIRERLQR
jgi:O-antigen/teichoic acid export membrane protein